MPGVLMPLENLPDPNQGAGLWSIIMALTLSIWGGVVNYLNRVRAGKQKFAWKELATDLFTSAFAGFVVFLLGSAFGAPDSLTGAMCGLAGHYGARTIFLLRSIVINKAEKFGDD
jgi:hypothetical protein